MSAFDPPVWWRATRVITDSPDNEADDMWSPGVTAGELVYGSPLCKGEDQ